MDQPFHLQLKSARERQGLSLEDVSHRTRIPVARLQLLEAGNYAGIGSMAYARGFLRSYARFLGLDAEGAAQSLPQPILGGANDYQYLTQSLGPWVRTGKKTRSHSPRAAAQAGDAPSGRSLTMKAAALVTLISSGCVAWAIYVGGTESAQNARKDREEKKAAAADSAIIRRAMPREAEEVASAIQIRPAVVAQ
jgi:cytoskeletal protein RodZ